MTRALTLILPALLLLACGDEDEGDAVSYAYAWLEAGEASTVTMDVDAGWKRVWLDGEEVASCSTGTLDNPGTDGPLWIGTKAWTSSSMTIFYTDLPWAGGIDEVRISSTARYSGDLEPERWFVADADTELLYHFSEGWGNDLEDASDNGYTGQSYDLIWDDQSSACDGG